MSDNKEFWLDFVRLTKSNFAVESYYYLEELIDSDRLDERTLRRLHGALRSISQKALEKANVLEAKRRRPWEFK